MQDQYPKGVFCLAVEIDFRRSHGNNEFEVNIQITLERQLLWLVLGLSSMSCIWSIEIEYAAKVQSMNCDDTDVTGKNEHVQRYRLWPRTRFGLEKARKQRQVRRPEGGGPVWEILRGVSLT